MPFFVRQQVMSVKVGVYIMKAHSKKAAEALPLIEGDYQGFYTNDSPSPVLTHAHGPFETKEEAQKSEAGWVEDI